MADLRRAEITEADRCTHLRPRHTGLDTRLDTRLAAAPYTGAPVFEMELLIAVPQGTSIAKLREQLGHLCDELNIDWELTAQ